MRLKLFIILLCFYTLIFSQEKFSKEFNFTTDNDLYISSVKDRYYTNGLNLKYSYTTRNIRKLYKKIVEFQIGQQIFTPYKSTITNLNLHDRPFAGYLNVSIGIINVYKNKVILKNKIQFGIVGENAFGKELQKVIHSVYNFRSPDGWKYQIRNTLAINYDNEYYRVLGINKSNNLDISFVGKLRIGTIFNEVSSGFTGRIGFNKLQPFNNSIAFNTHLNNKSSLNVRGVESFIYYQSSLTYVVYDATIQGSMFNDNSPITFRPKAIRFDFEIGYKFTAKRWSFGYGYHFHSNKINNLRYNRGNDYGRLSFSYLFQ